MSKAQEETSPVRNGPIAQTQAVNKSPSVSDSSDGGEEEIDEDSAVNMSYNLSFFSENSCGYLN